MSIISKILNDIKELEDYAKNIFTNAGPVGTGFIEEDNQKIFWKLCLKYQCKEVVAFRPIKPVISIMLNLFQ